MKVIDQPGVSNVSLLGNIGKAIGTAARQVGSAAQQVGAVASFVPGLQPLGVAAAAFGTVTKAVLKVPTPPIPQVSQGNYVQSSPIVQPAQLSQTSPRQNVATGIATGIGATVGGAFGGPIGGAIGGAIGGLLPQFLPGLPSGLVPTGTATGSGCGCNGSRGRDPCTHQLTAHQPAPLATFFGGCCPQGKTLRRKPFGRDICIRTPRMNPFNPRALARADMRITHFVRRAAPILADMGFHVEKHRRPVKGVKTHGRKRRRR